MLSNTKDIQPNLCSSYRAITQRNGLNLSEMLELINTECDLNITHSRFSEWESGKRSPKKEVINFILAQVIRDKGDALKLTPSQIKDLVESVRIA